MDHRKAGPGCGHQPISIKPFGPEPPDEQEQGQQFDSGAYRLILRVCQSVVIGVGGLGKYAFPSGTYIYTGRASKNLGKRIARHRREDKKLRWHVDYLLQHAHVADVRVYPGKAEQECFINRETARILQATFPVKGFGSSDCRCASHLMLSPRSVSYDATHAPAGTAEELTRSGSFGFAPAPGDTVKLLSIFI
jgi:Uri superfamily endonuclease